MEQDRKFTIAEFITTVNNDMILQLPPQLLEVLGIKPGQAINFLIDENGNVTVEAYTKAKKHTAISSTPDPITEELEQATLFEVNPNTYETEKRHKSHR